MRIKEFLKNWSETFKNWAEVIAFVGAAWWAVHTYVESVRPDREIRINTSSTLDLPRFDTGLCQADFTVTLENESKKPVQMSYIELKAFRLDTSKIAGGTYLDDQEFVKKAAKFDDKRVTSGVFGSYPLNVKSEGTYSWFIAEQPHTAIGFEAKIYAKGIEEPVAYEMQWRMLKCGTAPTTSTRLRHKSTKGKKQ